MINAVNVQTSLFYQYVSDSFQKVASLVSAIKLYLGGCIIIVFATASMFGELYFLEYKTGHRRKKSTE